MKHFKYQLNAKGKYPHFTTNDVVEFCKEVEARYGIEKGDIKTAKKQLPRAIKRNYERYLPKAKVEAGRRFQRAAKGISLEEEWKSLFKIDLEKDWFTKKYTSVFRTGRVSHKEDKLMIIDDPINSRKLKGDFSEIEKRILDHFKISTSMKSTTKKETQK